MEYINLERGYLLTILLPISYIYIKLIVYQHTYFQDKFKRIIIASGAIFGIVSTTIIYFIGFEIYFCFIWGGAFLLAPISVVFGVNFASKFVKNEIEDYRNFESYQIIFYILSFLVGCFFVILPFTRLYYYIGGNISDMKIRGISKVLFAILGICFITLNKTFTYFTWKTLKNQKLMSK